MSELLPCPFCGGEARVERIGKSGYLYVACNTAYCCDFGKFDTEAEAIEAWNSRAAMEFDNWFYLPKPKEPIVEVTETTHAWDGTKVKTDVFYQVQEQAVINWAKELDEHIIKRICEVWNSRAERTCECVAEQAESPLDGKTIVLHRCSVCNELMRPHMNYCPNCGARVVGRDDE